MVFDIVALLSVHSNELGVATTDINHSELKLEKLISYKREKKNRKEQINSLDS